MEKQNFLYVRDAKIKELLEKSGYRLLQKKDDYWIFLNNKSNNFELNEQNKCFIASGNTLTF